MSLPREPVYLAVMPWLRRLAVLFAFLSAFARPAPASAFTPASLETRVGGFRVAARLLVGKVGAASREQHQGIGAAYDENASGYRFAAGGAPKLLGPGTNIGAKIEKQMAGRGWNREAVDKLISSPHNTRAVRDTRHLPGGGQLDDPATAYINRQGHYVIRNDRTGDIVQVSNRHDLDWGGTMGLEPIAEKRIQQAFADVGSEHGGEFFVPASAADRYIDTCVQESLAIIGVETFRLEGEKLKPILEQIADFSSMLTATEVWEVIVRETAVEAHRFVGQVPTEADVLLSFTLLSEQERRSG